MASIYKNALLAQFSDEARAALDLRPLKFEVNRPIYEVNEPIDAVYFVETGVISVVGALEDGRNIEVGTIGRRAWPARFYYSIPTPSRIITSSKSKAMAIRRAPKDS